MIRYTIARCPLGRLLVAATEQGVCAVYLGSADSPLEAELAKEYRTATIVRDDLAAEAWIRAILDYLDGHVTQLDLPLDLRATAFQRQVWEQLQAIPYGSTRTYRDIAQALGRPNGARAVGRACATNPVSIVIPCHRAVRQDGSLAGYRWGLDRKAALLAQERARAGISDQTR